nr:HAMP domain-containing histidine kinase [Desulfobulbaceae bacterium]
CQTCGAVIAIVSSLKLNKPVEKICIAEVKKNGIASDLYLGVRAAPILLSGHRFVLLFMQDLSAQQKLATLQRVFFHDLTNILTALLGYSEILALNSSGETLKTASIINKSAQNLYKEVVLQRILAHGELGDFQYSKENIPVSSILTETCDGLRLHPSANNKSLSVIPAGSDKAISSDRYIIIKILTNMLINALEASDEGDEVQIWAEYPQQDEIMFAVWNKKVIEESLKQRIFQKNFSTKNMKGRGLGTYSMKLFGEEILGGKVYFISQEETGTTFYLKLCRNN